MGMRYSLAQLAMDQVELQAIAQHMYPLMLRNIASEGFLFSDPLDQNSYSGPGCVLAAPSFPAITPGTSQDYVFNWVRDAAITAMEVAAAHPPVRPGGGAQTLVDYVNFAQLCQKNAIQAGSPTRACFRINGDLRDWTDQSDGPAVQTLAILSLFSQLDAPTQAVALAVANANVGILMNVYQQPTFNLWEEVRGNSFFARATQLRCLQEVQTNTIGIQVPGNIADAIGWLQSQLQGHWNGTYYVSILNPERAIPGYDPNIDIISASVYGAIPFTDTKLLATAAQIRAQFSQSSSAAYYPINGADATRGFGPLLGRYPGDTYDGDMSSQPRSSVGALHGEPRRALLWARQRDLFGDGDSLRQSLRQFLRAGRRRFRDIVVRCEPSAAASGRRHAAGCRLSQRRSGAERTVRRVERLRKERSEPDVELRGVFVRCSQKE